MEKSLGYGKDVMLSNCCPIIQMLTYGKRGWWGDEPIAAHGADDADGSLRYDVLLLACGAERSASKHVSFSKCKKWSYIHRNGKRPPTSNKIQHVGY